MATSGVLHGKPLLLLTGFRCGALTPVQSSLVISRVCRPLLTYSSRLDGPAMAWASFWREAPVGVAFFRLGTPVPEAGGLVDPVEMGTGDEADVDFMESAVGRVWRALALWRLWLLLLGLASLVGG